MKERMKRFVASILAALMVFAYMPMLGGVAYAANGYDYTVTTAIPDQTYTGEAPDLSQVDALAEVTTVEGVTMVRGTDFTVVTEDYHVGQGTANFTGIGNYEGKTFEPVKFNIKEAETTDAYEASVDESKIIYTGHALTAAEAKAAAKVIKNGNTRLDADDFDVAVTAPAGAKGDVGEKYTVKVSVVGKGTAANPEYSKDFTVTISKKDIKDAAITVSGTYTYNGAEQKATVASVVVGEETIAATDYDVTYKNNVNASSKAVAVVTVKDSCKNFTGSAEKTFTIAPADLSGARVIVTGTTVKYNGKVQKPALDVKAYFEDAVDAKQIPAADFEVSYPESKDVQSADYTVTIVPKSGTANLTGESAAVKAYKITPASLKDDVTITAKRTVPAGTDVTTNFKKYYDVKLGDVALVQGTDYTVAYTSTANIDKVGFDSTVELTAASGNFNADKASVTYTAGAKEFAKVYFAFKSFEYTGDTITPSASDLGSIFALDDEDNVVAPTDYIAMSWSNNVDQNVKYMRDMDEENIDPSKFAQVTIEGTGEHKGQTATVLFLIRPKDVSDYTIAAADLKGLSAGKYYQGQEITGVSATLKKSGAANVELKAEDCYVTIDKIESNKITEVTVYTNYDSNYDAEDGIKVTGLNIQSSPATLNDAVVSTDIPAGLASYSADMLKKYITVTVGGNVIAPDVFDLDIVSAPATPAVGSQFKVQLNAKADGSAEIAGSKDATLTVVQRDINDFAYYLDLEFWSRDYTGEEFKPALDSDCEEDIQDDYDAKQFKAGTDYELTYKDNVDAGKATVTVTGKGDYKGSVDLTFTIYKAELDDDDVAFDLPKGSDIQFEVGPVKDLSSKITMKAATGKKYVINASDYTVALNTEKTRAEVKATDSVSDPITIYYTVTINKDSKNYEYIDDWYYDDEDERVDIPVTFEASYNLIPKTVRNAKVTLENGLEYVVIPGATDFTSYDIGEVTVEVDGQTLALGTDYTVAQKGSGKIPSERAATDKAPYVEITFKGNYAGVDASTKVDIVAEKIDLSQVKLVPPAASALEYTGTAKVVEANDIGDTPLPEGSWEVVYTKNGEVTAPINAGDYKATVKATADYGSGEGESIEFTITPVTATAAQFKEMVDALSIDPVEYFGEATKTPELKGEGAAQFEVVSYDKAWDGNAATKGKAEVALKADANYKYDGTGEVKFDWVKGDLAHTDLEVSDFFKIEDQVYTGSPLEPELTAIGDLPVSYATIKYYESNVNIATKTAKAYVVVEVPASDTKYTGKFEGVVTFSIIANPDDAAAAEKAIAAAAAADAEAAAAIKTAEEKAAAADKAIAEAKTAAEKAAAAKLAQEAAEAAKVAAEKAEAAKAANDTAAAQAKAAYGDGSAQAREAAKKAEAAAAVATKAADAAKAAADKAAAAKAANPIKVKAKTLKVKASKKKTTFKKAKAFKVTGAQGKVTFKKVSGNKKITVSKAGKVTVKKGLKKGKTYKVKVKVTAAGNATYKAGSKTVTLKIKVK